MIGRSGTPRPGTPRPGTPSASTPQPRLLSGSRNPPRIDPNTPRPSTSAPASSQSPERLSPAAQNRLIDSWLSDEHDMNHSKPAVFWASEDWDRHVVQRDFIDTLRQVVEEEYARIQRSIKRLSGDKWQIPYLDWERVYEGPVLKNFAYAWWHQDEIDYWSLDLIKEWFTYLKDEAYWAMRFKERCEEKERFLACHPEEARWHPPGFITGRWQRTYP